MTPSTEKMCGLKKPGVSNYGLLANCTLLPVVVVVVVGLGVWVGE